MLKTSLGLNLYEKDDLFKITGFNSLNENTQKINEILENEIGGINEDLDSIDETIGGDDE